MQNREEIDASDIDPLQVFCSKFGASSPEQAMIIACEQLRKRADLKTPPFNLERLLSICNAKISNSLEIDIGGRLEFSKGSFVIKLRADDSRLRRRFSLAHEIAHILVTRAVADSVENLRALRFPGIHQRLERLCNFGAAELLSPQRDFLDSLREFGFSREGFARLQNRYDFSYETFCRKFTDISATCTVSLWKLYERSQLKGDLMKVVASFSGPSGLELKIETNSKSIAPNVLHHVSRVKKERAARASLRMRGHDVSILIFAIPAHLSSELLASLEKAYGYRFDVISLVFPSTSALEQSDPLLSQLMPLFDDPLNY